MSIETQSPDSGDALVTAAVRAGILALAPPPLRRPADRQSWFVFYY